jgi:Mg/Co/Ni transporter MgtE
VAVAEQATAADALAEIRAHEHLIDALTTVYLVDGSRRLTGAVPLARLAVAPPETPLQELAGETPQRVALDERQDRVTDRFDKYNLLALPVVDARNRLVGVITADDIISVLRVA